MLADIDIKKLPTRRQDTVKNQFALATERDKNGTHRTDLSKNDTGSIGSESKESKVFER